MSLYIQTVRRVIADTKAILDTIEQRIDDYARLEGLTEALNAMPGVVAIAHTDRLGGSLEIAASGDKAAIVRAIEATGHKIIHPGGHCWATIQPPADVPEFAMVFTIRLDESLAQDGNPLLNEQISSLGLCARPHNCLMAEGIYLVGQLVQRTADDLISIQGLGRHSLDDIRKELGKRGLSLATPL